MNIFEIIKELTIVVDQFKEVYIFGSILNPDVIPNDIDILIIYSKPSEGLNFALEKFLNALDSKVDLPVDLTVLSFEEEAETSFLSRIKQTCLKVK